MILCCRAQCQPCVTCAKGHSSVSYQLPHQIIIVNSSRFSLVAPCRASQVSTNYLLKSGLFIYLFCFASNAKGIFLCDTNLTCQLIFIKNFNIKRPKCACVTETLLNVILRYYVNILDVKFSIQYLNADCVKTENSFKNLN